MNAQRAKQPKSKTKVVFLNLVTDIFKVRNGQWTQVRIWSDMNLGTLKKKDLFITDSRMEPIEDFYTRKKGLVYELS